jgi:hypothetical protein
MRFRYRLLTLLIFFVAVSCTSTQYIYDAESRQRQEDLLSKRAVNTGCEMAGCMSSVLLSALLNTDLGYMPSEPEFRKLKLINTTPDTMYVNMLTDIKWDTTAYVDFNDVRIPPLQTWRVLVPIGIDYNLYFGTGDNPEKDELIQLNTAGKRTFKLVPGAIPEDKHEE